MEEEELGTKDFDLALTARGRLLADEVAAAFVAEEAPAR